MASDGVPIAATRFRSVGETRGVAVIAPATGVRQRYYRAFAHFLAGHALDVLTWDWRGIADSRYESEPSDARLTMRAWGERDLDAALTWARARAGTLPLLYVGHSFGGQALGLAATAPAVTRAAFIASQHGWFGHWDWPHRWALAALWHVGMPVLAGSLGHFPSARFGFGEDLPGPVALEWARWCRRRAFLGTWSGHASLDLPITALSFSDDWLAPRAAADALLAEYRRAVRTHRHLTPAEIGVPAMGHFGFFREATGSRLWPGVAQFLLGGSTG